MLSRLSLVNFVWLSSDARCGANHSGGSDAAAQTGRELAIDVTGCSAARARIGHHRQCMMITNRPDWRLLTYVCRERIVRTCGRRQKDRPKLAIVEQRISSCASTAPRHPESPSAAPPPSREVGLKLARVVVCLAIVRRPAPRFAFRGAPIRRRSVFCVFQRLIHFAIKI